MNIALVFPPFYLESMYNLPPLGLVNLATALGPNAHEVKIFDFPLEIRKKTVSMNLNIYKECARQILQFDPDVAGFSVQCTTYPPAVMIAGELKKSNPALKIVFGGHNASCVDELTLSRFPFIDVIVRGEGEVTFPELVQAFQEQIPLNSVDGITFRISDRITKNPDRKLIEDLDTLPGSDYAFVPPLHEYRDFCGISRSIAILEIGRGCPHRCVYCSQSIMWQRRTRTFSIKRILGEMKNLAENFGAECFLLAFDQFTAKRGFAEEFCRSLIEAGINHMPWYCISRLDTLDKDLLHLMRKAGCETMCYGIDSGSKKTLAFIRKDINDKILLDRVRETTEAGIIPTLSFVIGFPEENRDDLEATLELALKSAATGNTNILVQMATILPGTELYEKYKHALVREVDTYFSLGIEFDGGKRIPSDDELINSDPALFSSFYNLPCPAGTLTELNEIAAYFILIAAFYPRSFFLLSLELKTPIFDIFFSFLDRISEIERNAAKTDAQRPNSDKQDVEMITQGFVTPRSCLEHFSSFAAESLSGNNELVRAYIPEVVKYETCLLRAGESGRELSPFHIDIPKTLRGILRCNEKILIEKFTFDIPDLILQFKSGNFPETFGQRTVFCAFSRSAGGTEVREINEFGFDFLQLSDGQRDLAEIVDQLYPKYGTDKERGVFASMCAEAAGTLADLKLLVPFAPA